VNQAPKTANATFSATLCDQLWADGLTTAFIAPGSRSTPVALALVAHDGIETHVFHDERAASFAALGHGLATGRPAIVLCSSGTAGAHFYAAVIEAQASAVPLIVITADRPPELWGKGAPQTIDQTHLYGSRVRAFVEPGPPDDLDPANWRNIARELWTAATGPKPGPVHANLSFRDPLTGTPDQLPPRLDDLIANEVMDVPSEVLREVGLACDGKRGVIIAGKGETQPDDVHTLAGLLGWPILADHRSGCRNADSPASIRHFDALLRDSTFADNHRPDVVLRLGEIVSSKALSQWLMACAADGTLGIAGRPHGRHIDPEDSATMQFDEPGFIAGLISTMSGTRRADEAWINSWTASDQLAADVLSDALAARADLTEVDVARQTVAAVPAGGALVVSSSMPVRDVEWFGPQRNDIMVIANRGANGIDGIVSTAIGVALTGTPTICLIGDVAFLHDSSSLTALSTRPIDLTLVVINNDGGGIFSFLPQHELLAVDEYEALFGTPHGTDIAALVGAHGLPAHNFAGSSLDPNGVQVAIATTERESNLRVHEELNAAVAAALGAHRN